MEVLYDRKSRMYQAVQGEAVLSKHPTKIEARMAVISMLDHELYGILMGRIKGITLDTIVKREVKATEIVLSGKVVVHDTGELVGGSVLVATVDSNGDGEVIRQVHIELPHKRLHCTCEDFSYGHSPQGKCKHIRAYQIMLQRKPVVDF